MRRSLLDVPAARRWIARYLLCSVATTEKRVALTFDDGPHPRHTPQLLSLLEAEGIRATFFLVGRWAAAHPDLVRGIAAGGHEIGNHGYAHIPIPLLPGPLLRRDLERAGRAIEEATGTRPRFFRPPLGWFNGPALRVVRELGYEPVLGSVYARDSPQPGTRVIVEHMLARVEPGAILILHDGGPHPEADRSQSVAAAGEIIRILRDRGYRFETLRQLVEGGG